MKSSGRSVVSFEETTACVPVYLKINVTYKIQGQEDLDAIYCKRNLLQFYISISVWISSIYFTMLQNPMATFTPVLLVSTSKYAYIIIMPDSPLSLTLIIGTGNLLKEWCTKYLLSFQTACQFSLWVVNMAFVVTWIHEVFLSQIATLEWIQSIFILSVYQCDQENWIWIFLHEVDLICDNVMVGLLCFILCSITEKAFFCFYIRVTGTQYIWWILIIYT